MYLEAYRAKAVSVGHYTRKYAGQSSWPGASGTSLRTATYLSDQLLLTFSYSEDDRSPPCVAKKQVEGSSTGQAGTLRNRRDSVSDTPISAAEAL